MFKFPKLDDNSRRLWVDRKLNNFCLFHKIIGQDSAVDALADLLFKGLGNDEHCVPESVVLVGPPSSGKTTIVKIVGTILSIPTVISDATQLPKTDSVIEAIMMEYSRLGQRMVPEWERDGVTMIRVPPTVILIDEIHTLRKTVQEGLLKATERTDGMLFGDGYVLDCRKVFWVGATTDWGKLIPAFRTRFRRIDLVPATFSEVVLMVSRVMHWDKGLSEQLVKFGGLVPRECFAFARAVKDASLRSGVSIAEGIKLIAAREQIDEYGMRIQRLRVLQALSSSEKGCLLRTLVMASGCQQEELLSHWLPPLLVAPPGEMPLVVFDGKYLITPAGKAELKKRGK